MGSCLRPHSQRRCCFTIDPYGDICRTLECLKSLRTRVDHYLREEEWRLQKHRSRRVKSWFDEVAEFQWQVCHLPPLYQRSFSLVDYLLQKAARDVCSALKEVHRTGKLLRKEGEFMYRALMVAPYEHYTLSRSVKRAAAAVVDLFEDEEEAVQFQNDTGNFQQQPISLVRHARRFAKISIF